MLQLVFDAGSVRYYRGTIEARRGSPTAVYTVNELPVEEYLYGVVPREMPATWEIEALKAQAVAARSYALNKKVRARARGAFYDICASSGCQVYGGAARKPAPSGTKVALERDATNRAVQATAGTVMTTNGTPIFAEFSSSTGGYSAPGTAPYLAAVPDPTDTISPHHNWSARIRVSSIEARWPSIGRLLSVRVTKRNGFGEWRGRVTQMILTGTAGSATISGSAFRDAFTWPASPDGVRSTWLVPYYWDASLVQAPAQITVPSNGAVTVEIALKNTGNISWRIGSYVRLAAGSTRFADSSWVSSSRPAAVTANQADPSADRVRPGQVALFRFKLNANGATPGAYQETFRPTADGYTTMRPEISVSITVTPA
jgi:SpoIID/LytB domain protein